MTQLLATMIRSIPDRCVKLDKAMQAGEYVSRGSQDELTMAWINALRGVKGLVGPLKRLGDQARQRAGITEPGRFEIALTKLDTRADGKSTPDSCETEIE